MRRRRTEVLGLAALALAGCAPAAFGTATTVPSTLPSTTVPETGIPEITVPAGVLAAMPFQNRLDVAQGIFQLKLSNGTTRPLDVVGVQLVWSGLTTEVSHRENMLAAGDRLDYPVPLAPARCVGDGSAADMPDPNTGVAKVYLRDGSVVDAPVYDVKHFARALYLEDCERQVVERTVGVAWVGLHEAQYEGRPVTVGSLRLTRLQGDRPVAVLGVLNTINYTVFADTGVLAAGERSVDLPAGFQEGRCDVHALSESSQPFKFVVLLDLGDGVKRSLVVEPAEADRPGLRERSLRACEILGEVGFVGQDHLGNP